MKDWAKFSIGIDYGYGLMNFKTIPLLIPLSINMAFLVSCGIRTGAQIYLSFG